MLVEKNRQDRRAAKLSALDLELSYGVVFALSSTHESTVRNSLFTRIRVFIILFFLRRILQELLSIWAS